MDQSNGVLMCSLLVKYRCYKMEILHYLVLLNSVAVAEFITVCVRKLAPASGWSIEYHRLFSLILVLECVYSIHVVVFIAESRAIMRYVCERFPRQGTLGLYDYTGADKALVEQWLEVESQVLQPVLRPLVKQLLGPRMWNAQNVAVVPDEKIVAEHTQKLAKILDVYEVQLSKHKYLAGDFVSIADLSHQQVYVLYVCLTLYHVTMVLEQRGYDSCNRVMGAEKILVNSG